MTQQQRKIAMKAFIDSQIGYCRTENVSFRAQNPQDIIPKDLKKASSLQEFKLNVKKWKQESCICHLCKTLGLLVLLNRFAKLVYIMF